MQHTHVAKSLKDKYANPASLTRLAAELEQYEATQPTNWKSLCPTVFELFADICQAITKNHDFVVGYYLIGTGAARETTVKCELAANGFLQLTIGLTILKALCSTDNNPDDLLHTILSQTNEELIAANKQALIKAEEEFDLLTDAAGWDKSAPYTFRLLVNCTQQICLQLQAPLPQQFGIITNPSASFQALSSKQYTQQENRFQLMNSIIFGKDFIKKYLLFQSPETVLDNRKKFDWVIAHEISHLISPSLNRLAKLFNPLFSFVNAVSIYFWLSAINNILNMQGFLPTYCSLQTNLIVGSILTCTVFVGRIIAQRFGEYEADAITTKIYHDPAISYEVLCELDTEAYTVLSKKYPAFLMPLVMLWVKRLHPSTINRVNHIKKVISASK